MRIIEITKDDLSKMDPDLRDYYVAAAKARKRQRRVNRVRRSVKGAVMAGAAVAIYTIGSKTSEK